MLPEEELNDLDKAAEREAVEYRVGDLAAFSGAMYARKDNCSIQLDHMLTGEFKRLENKVFTVMRIHPFEGDHPIFKNWYSVSEQDKIGDEDSYIELHGCEMVKVESLKLGEGDFL